jgi:hypothetical protein
MQLEEAWRRRQEAGEEDRHEAVNGSKGDTVGPGWQCFIFASFVGLIYRFNL